MSKVRFLTGITPSGTPHLGNYAGMLKPAIKASLNNNKNIENFYFIADYHALIKTQNPERINRCTLEIASSWLACGLNPDKVIFYRQSDIPEIPELCWLLTCVTGKGILNRAHAYKSACDKNELSYLDLDNGITAGLFMYPLLMAADILMFNANKVPVGRDQIQHIEMTRNIANYFNNLYGDFFILPEASIEENVAVLPGLDGRKMSKSYNNTIPLFCNEKQLKKLINSIVTDSKLPNEKKDVNCALFDLYKAFASNEEINKIISYFNNGIAWSEVKNSLFDLLNTELKPMRENYNELINNSQKVENILQNGSEKARRISKEFIKDLRSAVGLRNLINIKTNNLNKTDIKINKKPQFKQYKENNKFYFKLVDEKDNILLESLAFDDPKLVGEHIKHLLNLDNISNFNNNLEIFKNLKLFANIEDIKNSLNIIKKNQE